MKKLSLLLVLGALLATSNSGLTQSDGDNEIAFEHWQKLTAKYDFNKDFSISADVSTRWETDPSDLRQIYFEIEPSYEIMKWLDVEVGYRLISNTNRSRNRFYGQLSPTLKLNKRWRIAGRFRYEMNERRTDYEPRIRLKVRPEYELRKSVFMASAESYLIEGTEREKERYSIGYRYELTKKQDLGIRLIYDVEERNDLVAVEFRFRHEF